MLNAAILLFLLIFLLVAFGLIIYCLLELSSYIYTWFFCAAPYVPNNYLYVIEALNMAGVTRGDIVVDLGSGDGRVLLVALRDFKVKKALGVETDFFQVFKSSLRLRWAKTRGEVLPGSYLVHRGDFFDLDFSDATVVYLYLYPHVLASICGQVISRLASGTRVVSCRYKLPSEFTGDRQSSSAGKSVKFEKSQILQDKFGGPYEIFLYTVI